MPHVQLVPHYRIASVVDGIVPGPEGVFARYVMSQAPDGCSHAIIDGNRVVAFALWGRPFGFNEVWPHWVHATETSHIEMLVREIPADDVAICYPPWSRGLVDTIHPGLIHSVDHLLVQPCEHDSGRLSENQPVKLEHELLATLVVASELRPLLGRFEEWTAASELYGIVHGNELISLGDISVRDSRHCAVQQLFTVDSRRRWGYARSLAAWLSDRINAQGLSAVYVASAANIPSLRIASRCGFRLVSKWGYAESM